MASCTVTCFTCRNSRGTGPKTWREGCKDCAQDTFDKHRRTTGHTDMHLAITVDDAPTLRDLQERVIRAGQIHKLGWTV